MPPSPPPAEESEELDDEEVLADVLPATEADPEATDADDAAAEGASRRLGLILFDIEVCIRLSSW